MVRPVPATPAVTRAGSHRPAGRSVPGPSSATGPSHPCHLPRPPRRFLPHTRAWVNGPYGRVVTRLRNVAVVLAGGTGTRVGLSIPKQLIKVAGKPIIEHTIGLLQASPLIDGIIVLMTPGHLDAVRAILRPGSYPKVTQVLEGAETRNATTQRALDALGRQECNVLFHDAVRPLLSQRVIEDCIAALSRFEAVDTAIPSADTII